ncbi:MAG: SPOR domain-containing protein [Burkholderiales bacterium]
MALFRPRSIGRDTENRRNPKGSAESVESMRRRARHRLIGAAVLVAAGVVGFPLLFDTQPRPVAKDIPIELPERNALKPADVTGSPVAPAVGVAASGAAIAAAPPLARSSAAPAGRDPVAASVKPLPSGPDVKKFDSVVQADSAPEPDPSTARPRKSAAEAKAAAEKVAEKPPERAAEKSRPTEREPSKATAAAAPIERPGPKPPSRDELRIAKLEESARARALLQGRSEKEAAAAAASVGRRYVVQIGAFSEPERARSARAKAERAGVKTFMQETKIGSDTWIRVRVGPFATRAEADDAASKLKGVSLPASILTM